MKNTNAQWYFRKSYLAEAFILWSATIQELGLNTLKQQRSDVKKIVRPYISFKTSDKTNMKYTKLVKFFVRT